MTQNVRIPTPYGKSCRQIVGFDINEAALRFAALGIYLMSIESDPEPEPVEELRFTKNLRGIVLHALRTERPRALVVREGISANTLAAMTW